MGTRSGDRARSRPHTQARPTPRGSVHPLPSGSLRVRVYAGKDVLTGKPHYVGETIRPGPHAQKQAEEATRWWVDEVRASRHAKTNASLVQIIEAHLKQADLEGSTRDAYPEWTVRHH